jgi:phytol kinase
MRDSLESLPSLWFPLTVVILYLGGIILCAELLNRLQKLNGELTRKVVHIGTGNVILLAWWLDIPPWIAIAASVIASVVALLSYYLPILPSVNSVGRKSLGTFFYAISIGVLVAWFWQLLPQYTAIGILVMSWGDGMAAIVGQNFGKHPFQFLGNKKSWEGSLTMAIVSFLVTGTILLGVGGDLLPTLGVSLAVALCATFLETFSLLGVDNLTVPLGSAAIAFYLNQLWII